MELEPIVENIIKNNENGISIRCIKLEIIKRRLIKECDGIDKLISSICSKLIVKNYWTICREKNRNIIYPKSVLNKTELITVENHLVKGERKQIVLAPLTLPKDGDWVCFDKENRVGLLFYRNTFSRSEVRNAYCKAQHIPYKDVRAKLYHKINTLREAKNNY